MPQESLTINRCAGPTFQCTDCRNFLRPGLLRRYEKTYYGKKETIYRCRDCADKAHSTVMLLNRGEE